MVVFVRPHEESPQTRRVLCEAIKRRQEKARLLSEIADELHVPVERIHKIIFDDLFGVP